MARWIWKTIAVLGVAFLALGTLRLMPTHAINWPELDSSFLLLALCVAILQEALAPMIARAALKAVGSDGRWLSLLAIVTIAATANSAVPGPAGTPLRVWLQTRLLGVSAPRSTAAAVLEAVFGYMLLAVVAVLCTVVWMPRAKVELLNVHAGRWYLLMSCAVVGVVGTGFVLLQLRRKLPTAWARARQALQSVDLHKRHLLTLSGLHLAVILLAAVRLALVLRAVSDDLGVHTGVLLASVAIARIATVFSMLPMGLGARDAGLVACLAWAGIPLGVGAAAAVIDRIVMTLPYLAGGLISIVLLRDESLRRVTSSPS
jgi:uncharacterized membrane protein YbhN (UPF0104 family)